MFMVLIFNIFSYMLVRSDSYQWTVLSKLDNDMSNFVKGINPSFPLRAGCVLLVFELDRQIRFLVPPTDMLQRCIYLTCK